MQLNIFQLSNIVEKLIIETTLKNRMGRHYQHKIGRE